MVRILKNIEKKPNPLVRGFKKNLPLAFPKSTVPEGLSLLLKKIAGKLPKKPLFKGDMKIPGKFPVKMTGAEFDILAKRTGTVLGGAGLAYYGVNYLSGNRITASSKYYYKKYIGIDVNNRVEHYDPITGKPVFAVSKEVIVTDPSDEIVSASSVGMPSVLEVADVNLFSLIMTILLVIVLITRLLSWMQFFLLLFEHSYIFFNKQRVLELIVNNTLVFWKKKGTSFITYTVKGYLALGNWWYYIMAYGAIISATCLVLLNSNTLGLAEPFVFFLLGTFNYIGVVYPFLGMYLIDNTKINKIKIQWLPMLHFLAGLIMVIPGLYLFAKAFLEIIISLTIFA